MEVPLRAAAGLRGARVLLVDDNGLNQQVGSELLAQFGMVVCVASHGQEALERLSEQAFDIVLMDMQMPVMDGLTATRHIRANPAWAGLPVLAMTANAMTGDRDACLAAGMNDHIAKPIDPPVLLRQLLRHVPPRDGIPTELAEEVVEPAAPASDALHTVPGLNVASGLKRVLQRRDTYIALLRKFVAGESDAADRAWGALQRGDVAEARRAVHTLKGNAATVGAQALADAAEALEARLIDPEHALAHTDELGRALAQLGRASEDLIAALHQALPAPAAVPEVAVDWPAARALTARLLALLSDDDADAVELFQAHEPLLKAALGRHHAPLAQAMNGYDLDQSLQVLRLAVDDLAELQPLGAPT